MNNKEERKETNTLILGIILGACFVAGLLLSLYVVFCLNQPIIPL